MIDGPGTSQTAHSEDLVDLQAMLGRAAPCHCERKAATQQLSSSTARGYLIEYVQCLACGQTWHRHEH